MKFQDSATNQHFNHLKPVLHYLKATANYGLTYTKNLKSNIVKNYADADYANEDDAKSISGILVKFSTKISKAVKFLVNDDNINNNSKKFQRSPNLGKISAIPKKELLCTTLPHQTIQELTDFKNLPFMYLKLSKIRLTTLVVITTMAGYSIAAAPFNIITFLCCCVGTGLVSSAANAINQYHEVPFDAQMSRTKNRVLVKAQLTPLHALGFAFITSISGLIILFCGCNGLTASLGVSNLILYTCIYTPLKRISILNTWIGSVVGAIPPVMGWVSCTGHLDSGAWLLAAILYAWQFPHFNALSWNLRPDYSKAGYRMMAVTNPSLCRRTALRYTVAITVLCCLAPICDVTNYFFILQTLPLNLYFTYLAFKFYRKSDSASSRKLFRFSLLHLPILITLMLINKKHWFPYNNNVHLIKSVQKESLTTSKQTHLHDDLKETLNMVKLT
ncbi:hypothetical protein PGB90_003937 [Kerria lacca]